MSQLLAVPLYRPQVASLPTIPFMRLTPQPADERLGIKLATRPSSFLVHPRYPLAVQNSPSVAAGTTAVCDISSRLHVEAGAEPTIHSGRGRAPDDPSHAAMLLPSSPGIDTCKTEDLKLAFILLLLAFEYVLFFSASFSIVYLSTKRSRAFTNATPAKLRAKSYLITIYPLTLALFSPSFPSLFPYRLSTQ